MRCSVRPIGRYGESYRFYRRGQQGLHLVEIDLLSSGLYAVVLPEAPRADLPLHGYRVCARRGPDRHRFEIYPVPLSKQLPRMQVPREPDPDVVLDGQAVLDRCYDDGGYAIG